ncbi:Hypothetical protein A7982_06188 [Minicystis rosea]|nr:Hypothetical protein A7982_06188 [Minicystis rosea]
MRPLRLSDRAAHVSIVLQGEACRGACLDGQGRGLVSR